MEQPEQQTYRLDGYDCIGVDESRPYFLKLVLVLLTLYLLTF